MRRRLTLRLNAAQRAAQLFEFTLIGDFLTLGNLDEFQNFVHLIVQFLQRRGDEHRVFNSLRDGGRLGGAKVRGLDPLALADRNARRRLRRTFVAPLIAAVIVPLFAAWLARAFGCSLDNRFWLVRRGGRRVFMRVETFGGFRMWFAKTASRFGVVFRVRRFGRFQRRGGFAAGFNGLRRGRNYFRRRFFRCRARTAAAAATTSATTAAIAVGATWRIQIGLFVWHKLSGEDGGLAAKSNGELR